MYCQYLPVTAERGPVLTNTQRHNYLLYQLTATANEFRVRALGHELLPATWLDCYDKPGGQYRQRSVQVAAVQVH
jgi:hypothetical protein